MCRDPTHGPSSARTNRRGGPVSSTVPTPVVLDGSTCDSPAGHPTDTLPRWNITVVGTIMKTFPVLSFRLVWLWLFSTYYGPRVSPTVLLWRTPQSLGHRPHLNQTGSGPDPSPGGFVRVVPRSPRVRGVQGCWSWLLVQLWVIYSSQTRRTLFLGNIARPCARVQGQGNRRCRHTSHLEPPSPRDSGTRWQMGDEVGFTSLGTREYTCTGWYGTDEEVLPRPGGDTLLRFPTQSSGGDEWDLVLSFGLRDGRRKWGRRVGGDTGVIVHP